MEKLNSIKNLSLVDKVENNLLDFFRDENLQPGDALPKEVELADSMGVSRTAVREALTRLKLLGLVDSRRNRGMIITSPDILKNVKRVMAPWLLDGHTMKEIFELRLIIEIGIGDVIFIRKNDNYIKLLEDIVIREEGTNDRIEKIKIDVEFHSMLYKISENKTLMQFQKMLLPVFNYVNNGYHVKSQIDNEDYVSHRVILETLKKGTPEKFRNKMRSHLAQYFEKI